MEPVLRALGCYLLLLVVVRLSGKRGLAQVTIFDLILLLLISQTVGQALIGNDSSLTTAAVIGRDPRPHQPRQRLCGAPLGRQEPRAQGRAAGADRGGAYPRRPLGEREDPAGRRARDGAPGRG